MAGWNTTGTGIHYFGEVFANNPPIAINQTGSGKQNIKGSFGLRLKHI